MDKLYVTVMNVCFPDVRVKDYPLMQGPLQMTAILLGYVFFSVYAGPRLMANRKPYRLNSAMITYNLSMVLLNAYIVYEVRKMMTQIPQGDLAVVLLYFFINQSSCEVDDNNRH